MSNTDICLNCFKPKKGYDVCPSCGWYDGAEPANANHLYPGSILRDRYLVGMSVGFGGFGITYKAWDSKLGTVVAIKEFYPSGLVNRVPKEKNVVVYSGDRETQFHEQKKRFLDEARTMSKFTNHPNIVNVFDFFEENNTAYIVMEYLDGISVKKYLEQFGGKLDENSAVDIILPILDALTAIHSKKIVHRDISPDNIFLTLDNKIKLLDLGAARLTNSEKEETLSVIIKPGYAPPEQYRSKSKQGAWTDIYGVGATMYKILTGVTPEESIDRSVKDTLKKPSSLGASVSNKFDRIIMKAMAIKPELRFQSAQQMKNALLQQKEVDFPEDELKKRTLLRRVLIVAVSVLTALLLTTVTLFLTVFKPEPTLATVSIQPGTISMVLPKENQEAFDQIIKKFNEEYAEQNYQFNVTYATNEEMAAKSAAALPTLMGTDSIRPELLSDQLLPLDMLLRSIPEQDYVFNKTYSSLYPSKLEIPLGFEVLTGYVNTAVKSEVPDSFEASDALLRSDNSVIVGNQNYSDVLRLYDENALSDEEDGIHISEKASSVISAINQTYADEQYKNRIFINAGEEEKDPILDLAEGRYGILIADTTVYKSVQSTLAGFYRVVPVTSAEGKLVGSYCMHLGVNKNASENEQYIAQLFLAYCLSDEAQNILQVQNQGNLPVNKQTLATYANINHDLKFVDVSQLLLTGESRRFYNTCSSKIEELCFSESLPINWIMPK